MEQNVTPVKEIKTIGVLTSGGDAPGMNACIRAVVRCALNQGVRVVGIRKGYAGLLKGNMIEMNAQSVANIIHRGGTMLYTARCLEFLQPEYQDRAAEMCKIWGVNAIVVIGGDGSFKGAQALSKRGINVVGIPGTIDLDISCSEYTIGFDTAVNVVMDCVSRLRDTSASHERCSIVEVMGHNCGAIALWAGISTGADAIVIPEDKESQRFERIVKIIMGNRASGKNHNIIIVSEGVDVVEDLDGKEVHYNSQTLAKRIQQLTGIESRTTVLGHIQRGGNPTAMDVKHASMMGDLAVKALLRGETDRIIAVQDGKYVDIDIDEGLAMKKVPMMDIWEANHDISSYR